MIGNPCAWFINGNDQEKFIYEGGKFPYHFSPYESGLSTTMEMNILFFANSIVHAKDVLKRMLEFGIAAMVKYDKTDAISIHTEEFKSKNKYKIMEYEALINNIDKWKIIPVNCNQIFKVSWACNDTI